MGLRREWMLDIWVMRDLKVGRGEGVSEGKKERRIETRMDR